MSKAASLPRYSQSLAITLACLVFAPATLEAKCKVGQTLLTPGDHTYSIDFDGKTHSLVLHVPPKYDGKTPVPLVFDLHGFSSSGPGQLSVSGFKAVADTNNFLVVAPTGYMNSWNGDIAFGAAYDAKLDDVGLMKAIIEYVGGMANINRGKVYSTGLSNGAAMTNTLGCQAADTFAAIAPVADPLDIGIPTCKPAHPISVIGFHGYQDEYVPYEGGAGSGPKLPTPFPSIPDTLKAWAKIMECTGAPETMTISGDNKCEIYKTCGGGNQVGYCSLDGGHVLYQQNVLNIADYAWKFFDQFSLPLPDADGDKINDQDDNCPMLANPDQGDADGNCVGDACECKTAADCDDEKFCNGEEACMNGACVSGKAACDAAMTCDEAKRSCAAGAAAADAGVAMGAGGAAPSGSAGMSSAAPTAGTPSSAAPAAGTNGASAKPPSTPSGTDAGSNTLAATSGVSAQPAAPPESKASGGCSAAPAARASLWELLALFGYVGLRRKRAVTDPSA